MIDGLQYPSLLKGFFDLLKGSSDNAEAAEKLIKYVKEQQEECCICRDLVKTMERYCEVITYMYFAFFTYIIWFDIFNISQCFLYLKR